MEEVTDVTIIGNNINENILNDYATYKSIRGNFTYEELVRYKRIIFYNILNNLKDDKIKELYDFLKKSKILFINVTNNIEHILLTENLIIYKDNTKVLKMPTKKALETPKKFQELGLAIPFIVELSQLLNYYNLVDKTIYDKKTLKEHLWK